MPVQCIIFLVGAAGAVVRHISDPNKSIATNSSATDTHVLKNRESRNPHSKATPPSLFTKLTQSLNVRGKNLFVLAAQAPNICAAHNPSRKYCLLIFSHLQDLKNQSRIKRSRCDLLTFARIPSEGRSLCLDFSPRVQ